MIIKKCQKNISVLVKKVLEYRPGLCSGSYLQKLFFLEILKRLKLLKILPKVLLNTRSSTWYFIFKRILPVFFSGFFQDLELPGSFFLDLLLKISVVILVLGNKRRASGISSLQIKIMKKLKNTNKWNK